MVAHICIDRTLMSVSQLVDTLFHDLSYSDQHTFNIVFVSLPEIQLLGEHGVMLPPNMQGLTEEQVEELKLVDEYRETCIPSGGFVVKPDPVGRRNGRGKMKTLQLLEFWAYFTLQLVVVNYNHYPLCMSSRVPRLYKPKAQ